MNLYEIIPASKDSPVVQVYADGFYMSEDWSLVAIFYVGKRPGEEIVGVYPIPVGACVKRVAPCEDNHFKCCQEDHCQEKLE